MSSSSSSHRLNSIFFKIKIQSQTLPRLPIWNPLQIHPLCNQSTERQQKKHRIEEKNREEEEEEEQKKNKKRVFGPKRERERETEQKRNGIGWSRHRWGCGWVGQCLISFSGCGSGGWGRKFEEGVFGSRNLNWGR